MLTPLTLRKLTALLITTTLGCLIHFYPANNPEAQAAGPKNSSVMQSWDNQNTFTPPYHHNAYGFGVHSDRNGKAFQYQTQDGQTVPGFSHVQPNAFGYGVGRDQFGRAVKPKPYK